MSVESDFQELIMRVRAQDNDACAELLRCYGPTLQRIARVRLQSYGLQWLVNPSDVIQSVMALFFVRAAEGKYVLDEPAHYQKLMATMVDYKVNDHRKKQDALKRGRGRPVGDLSLEPVDQQPTPSEVVAGKELYEKVWSGLSDQDQELVRFVLWDMLSWHEIGARLGLSHEAARKRFERLCASVRERWQKEAGHG
jgi:DNA-directed RNA polymerase specialized sigma24 family protein